MKVAIVGHRRPDGDAIGAMFGMREYVKTRIPTVKEISLVVPDPIPDNAAWLPLLDDVLVGDEEKIREANLIICCDFSIPSRAGSLEKAIRESHADYKWSVDHHDNPDTDFWDDIICKPDYSSTCEVVMDLVRLEDCSKEVLTHLMNGIVTNTKNLDREGDCKSNPREAIKTLETWGSLSRDIVARKSLWEKSREGFILEAYILENTFFPSPSIAILTLTLEERHKFGYRPGMTDNIIERVLAIRDIDTVFYFREEEDGHVKVSVRGKTTPVLQYAKDLFGGGGHPFRAGADWYEGKINNAVALVIERLC